MAAPLLQTIKNVYTGSTQFSLQSYPDFPYSDWIIQQQRYAELDKWYTGVALRETVADKAGNLVEKFPLHINPIKGTCEKHASVLFGMTLESIRDGGIPINFIPKGDDTNVAGIVSEAISRAFEASGGGSLFISNGMVSQYLGGCVWNVCSKPWNKENPIQVTNPSPTEFLAYPDGTNFWDLREVWFVREVSWTDARYYGYQVPENYLGVVTPSDPAVSGYKYYYIEHWTKDTYRISINEMTIVKEGVALEGTNPFQLVPFVYIPHLRGNKFIGEGIITDTVKGIVKELNLRKADIGDAISDDAHSILATRGIKGSLKAVKIPDGRTAVDLGSSAGLGANETPPDLFAVKTQSASAPQLSFVEHLTTDYRVEAKHPAVADGLDEGSQRSALTLTTRMWPLQAHVDLERINWTVGLLRLAKIILSMCALKGTYDVLPVHIETKLIIKWAAMLPKDRDALVNEVAIRKKNDLGSRKHLIGLFGDVDNVEDEIKLIDEDMQKTSVLTPKPLPFGGGQNDNTVSGKVPQAQNNLSKKEPPI